MNQIWKNTCPRCEAVSYVRPYGEEPAMADVRCIACHYPICQTVRSALPSQNQTEDGR